MAVELAGRESAFVARSSCSICARVLVMAGGRPRRSSRLRDQAKSVEGFGESRRGDVPEGTAEMMTARDRQGDQERPGLAGADPERRRLVRQRDLSRQHRGDQPVRAGVHGVGLEPGPRARMARRSTRRWST